MRRWNVVAIVTVGATITAIVIVTLFLAKRRADPRGSATIQSSRLSQEQEDTTTENGTLRVDPINVSGRFKSCVFQFRDTNHAIDLFGTDSGDNTTLPFDMGAGLMAPLKLPVEVEDGVECGWSDSLVMLFSFIDIHFNVPGTIQHARTRVAMADTSALRKGDKVWFNETTRNYEWLDTKNGSWYPITGLRPEHASTIEEIANYKDPYYPLVLRLSNPIDFTGIDDPDRETFSLTIDIDMRNAFIIQSSSNRKSILRSFSLGEPEAIVASAELQLQFPN